MDKIKSWLSHHKFEAHLIAFIMMILPPVAMYYSAQRGAEGWIWGLLTVIILANLLAVLVK